MKSTPDSQEATEIPLYPPDYGNIDAQAHLETLSTLSQARDFLSRLPANPETHRVLKDIRAHLDSPRQVALNKRLLALAESHDYASKVFVGNQFKGHYGFTPAGVPLLECTLLDMALNVSAPALRQLRQQGGDDTQLSAQLLKDLEKGISLKLSQPLEMWRKAKQQASF